MYAFVQEVPIDERVYEDIRARLGDEPLRGLVVHLALRSEAGRLRYVDVWESEELCDRAFEERIHPAVRGALQEAGVRPTGEPGREVVEVVDVWRGTAAP